MISTAMNAALWLHHLRLALLARVVDWFLVDVAEEGTMINRYYFAD
jgi:hypothetical protein